VAGKKRKKQRNRQRQTFAATPARPVPDSAAQGSPTASPAIAPSSSSAAVAAGRSPAGSGSGTIGPRRPLTPAAVGTIDIDARVPYFTSDLRRVLITAAVMIALIVVGSLLIH